MPVDSWFNTVSVFFGVWWIFLIACFAIYTYLQPSGFLEKLTLIGFFSNPMFFGYAVFDEVALIVWICALMLRTQVFIPASISLAISNAFSDTVIPRIFFLICIWMLVQSLVGMLADWRVIRYFVLFFCIGWLIAAYYPFGDQKIPTTKDNKISGSLYIFVLLNAVIFLVFNALMLDIGLLGAHAGQGYWITGSTALAPSVFGSLLLVLHFKLDRGKKLALTGIFLSYLLILIELYSSRILELGLVFFVLILAYFSSRTVIKYDRLRVFGASKLLKLSIIGSALLFIIFEGSQMDSARYFNVIESTDADRLLVFLTVFKAWQADWIGAVFGYGFYGFRDILPPFRDIVWESFGLGTARGVEIYRGPLWATMLVDIGFFGICLLCYGIIRGYFLGIKQLDGDFERVLIFSLVAGIFVFSGFVGDVRDSSFGWLILGALASGGWVRLR